MLRVLEEGDGHKLFQAYYNILSQRGYIKRGITKKYIMWLFLMALVNDTYALITDDDYNKINEVLFCMFAPETWLTTYEIRDYNISVQNSAFYAHFSLRKSELDMLRKAESDELRATEG